MVTESSLPYAHWSYGHMVGHMVINRFVEVFKRDGLSQLHRATQFFGSHCQRAQYHKSEKFNGIMSITP